MKTALTTALFIVNIEGTVHMGNIFKDILDGLSTPAKEPVKQKATGLGAKSSFGQAFAEARDEQGSGGEFEYKGKSYTTNFAEENTVAKLYKAVVLEQNKDDNGNTPTGSTTSIAYNSTSDDDSDVISQGYYPDKIIRDSLRSGKLGSSSPRRNMTTEALDDIENAIEKSRREAVKNAERSRNSRTNFNVVTGDFFLDQDTGITADPMISGTPSDREDRRMYGGPPSDPVELRGGPPSDPVELRGGPPSYMRDEPLARISRDVDALEGPEASGPISGPVPAGEKKLTYYERFIKNLTSSGDGKGMDPDRLFNYNPNTLDVIDRDVDALEAPEALGSYMSRPFGLASGADRMKVINESPVFKNYKYNLTTGINNDNDVRNVQGMLTEMGYKPNGIDNVQGEGTARALRKFQAINGLTITGELDVETMDKLKTQGDMLAFPDPPKKDAKVTVLVDADFDIFKNEVGKIESGNVYTYYQRNTKKIGGFGIHRKGDLFYGGSGDKYMGRYQMGTAALQDSGYNTEKIHGDMTKAQKDAFIKNPALQDAEFKKYTKRNHIHLTKNSAVYRAMTKEEKLGILGYAHNQGATAAEEYLVTGVSGKDAFGTKGTKYTEALRAAFAEQVRTQSKAQ